MTWYRNLGTSVGGFKGSRRWAKYDQTTLSEIFNKLIKIFAANRNFWYPIQETILKETVSFTTVQILQWCIKESCKRWIEVVNHCIKEIITLTTSAHNENDFLTTLRMFVEEENMEEIVCGGKKYSSSCFPSTKRTKYSTGISLGTSASHLSERRRNINK